MILDHDSGRDESVRAVLRKFFVYVLDLSLLFGLLGIYILLYTKTETSKEELVRLEKLKQELEREQSELRINIEYLSSPEQLERIARDRFGMVPLTAEKIFLVHWVAATNTAASNSPAGTGP